MVINRKDYRKAVLGGPSSSSFMSPNLRCLFVMAISLLSFLSFLSGRAVGLHQSFLD